jgi:D-alanine-D-alanine ligase
MMLRAGQKLPNAPKIAETLGLPCFIKSNVGGSSFGCTKVKTVEDIYPAIERAFQEGDEVICESFMQGTEVTCGVYKTKEKAVAFPITEVVTHNEFFDYNAKYKGEVDEITPARIPDAIRDKIQAETLRLYDIIGANGIIRVDWIITGDKINPLEVNTTPGMTPTSFIPQQVRAAGLDIKDVLTDIIENKFV